MDLANLFLFCLISCVIGAVIMLIAQYYIFVKYFQMKPEEIEQMDDDDKSGMKNQKYILPQTLMDSLKSLEASGDNGTIASLNLILQFLFFELRYSNKVRKWFDRKLSLELDELISKTTTGKLFDKLSIRDLDLGNQFPEIRNLRVSNVELHDKEEHIESLDVLLDIEYNGNFKLSIDADMVLGKKGFLSVKVKQVSGPARLQFTRKPFTHWSLGFTRDPTVDLAIESQIQGRQMQSNVTTLISNQIKKAIRRKHTLPNYKLRFKPFFHRLIYDDSEYLQQNGTLEITVRELTRIYAPTHITHVYCLLTLSAYQWVLARQQDDKNLTVSIDIEIHKAKNQQIGIVFKQTEHVIIETVIPNTPAAKAKLKRGDRCISIEGKPLSHINHVTKILKGLTKSVFMIRVERTIPGLIKNDAVLEDYADVYEDFNAISFTKNTDSVQFGANTDRSSSKERNQGPNSSSESSTNITPSNSPRKLIDKTKTMIRKNSETKSESSTKTDKSTKLPLNKSNDIDFPQHSTIDSEFSNFIRMNDLSVFSLNDNFNFINVNVFGRSRKMEENVLLGYLSIPLNNVLSECSEAALYIEKYNLMPPETTDLATHPLSSQSGFTPCICFGDILMSFVWNGDNKVASPLSPDDPNRAKLISENSIDGGDKLDMAVNKQHDFIRTHFHRSTQCEFCFKKIWLKDAYQCRNCTMSCHKKCITKCQSTTVCGSAEVPSSANSVSSLLDESSQQNSQPEFLVTTANCDDDCEEVETPDRTKLESHRQSFSNLIATGMKRVNSANNLAIPNIVSSLTNQSKSLPPTPQHTPRKQSLVTQNINPFMIVVHRLEQMSIDKKTMSCEEVKQLTEPLSLYGPLDDLMELAKSTDNLYGELKPPERIEMINLLLSKLRVALDSETLYQDKSAERSPNKRSDLTPNSQIESVQKSFINGQSEERLQVLSVIMLHLCSGLQAAQGDIK